MIVFSAAARVGEKDRFTVHNPMLLGIVVSQVGSIVKPPSFRCAECEAIVTNRHIALVVVTHGEKEAVAKFRNRWFVKPTLYRHRQFGSMLEVANLSIFKAGSHDGSRILVTLRFFEIEGYEQISIRKIIPLGASRPCVFKSGLIRQFNSSPI